MCVRVCGKKERKIVYGKGKGMGKGKGELRRT